MVRALAVGSTRPAPMPRAGQTAYRTSPTTRAPPAVRHSKGRRLTRGLRAVRAAAQAGMVAVAFGGAIGGCGLPVGASAMARAALVGKPRAARPSLWPLPRLTGLA